MNWADLGKTIVQYGAPLLGAALPIPGGAMLGQAIANMFGGDINNPEDLNTKIKADPDAAVKLASIESNERIEIQKLFVERMHIDADNTENARNREIEVGKIEPAKRDKVPGTIAAVFISGYFLVTFLIVGLVWTNAINSAEAQPIVELLKDLGYALMLILSYYFGASNNNATAKTIL